ncbi:hypothetical protein Smic_34660 [Streptomyces microflavus]|uniref:Uncharacterized protein n=1 Tax=Streptomyces microflavus TaxID=1919 RepID=A0A7J0CQY8_STRMI|nr:hypothetical protein Smic_34660 [Streptomyces microflavus]
MSVPGGLSEEKLAAVLEELLPPGRVSEARGVVSGDAKGPHRASVSAVYDDGKGKGSVLVLLYPAPGGKAAKGADCDEQPGPPPGIVSGEQGYDPGLTVCFDTGSGGGTGSRFVEASGAARAVFFTAGGVAVDARAYDRVTGGGAGATRTGPALDDKGLMELARAEEWRPLAAALETDADTVDTDGASRPPVEPEPDAEDLPRTGQETPRTGRTLREPVSVRRNRRAGRRRVPSSPRSTTRR